MNSEISITKSEIKRSVIESLDNKIRITDRDPDNNLDLFCYLRCEPEDPEIIRQCRGIVFNGENLVMQAFPYTTEYTSDNYNQICESIIPSECMFYDSHEGALIRMFHFNNKWYTSTHRKLDAFKSKWSSRESFGVLFAKGLESSGVTPDNTPDNTTEHNSEYYVSIVEKLQERLDKNKQYMFLVRNSVDNRIVCKPPTEHEPSVYHVGTFVNGLLDMTDDIGLPYPANHNFSNIDELLNYVNNINHSEYQGVIVFAPNNQQYKILNKNYLDLFNIRGNEPSIKFRYLQIRNDKHMVRQLRDLYPHMAQKFEDYEQALERIAKRIYNTIVDRFIKKLYSTVSNDEFLIVRECQKWHEQNRRRNRVCLDKIYEIINNQSSVYLNRIIKAELGEIRDTSVQKRLLPKNRVEQNTLDQNKIEQNRVEQNRVEQNEITVG